MSGTTVRQHSECECVSYWSKQWKCKHRVKEPARLRLPHTQTQTELCVISEQSESSLHTTIWLTWCCDRRGALLAHQSRDSTCHQLESQPVHSHLHHHYQTHFCSMTHFHPAGPSAAAHHWCAFTALLYYHTPLIKPGTLRLLQDIQSQ